MKRERKLLKTIAVQEVISGLIVATAIKASLPSFRSEDREEYREEYREVKKFKGEEQK